MVADLKTTRLSWNIIITRINNLQMFLYPIKMYPLIISIILIVFSYMYEVIILLLLFDCLWNSEIYYRGKLNNS